MIEPFKDPGLSRPTPLRIEGDVIYGHFAAWGTQHLARPGITPPRTGEGRYFHLSGYEHNGVEIDVGKITLHTTHAPVQGITSEQAIAHYEHTGTVAAYVRAGDDAHGAWFCGKVAKGLDEETLEALRAATPSGDWRGYNGRRELIGILAVNVPGFPIERERVLVAAAGSDHLALVASGLVVNEAGPGERLRLHMARKALARRAKR